MPTVGQKIADEVIAKGGKWPGDPLVIRIVEYDNAWGGKSYGLIYQGMSLSTYRETEFVRNPRIYWQHRSIKEPNAAPASREK